MKKVRCLFWLIAIFAFLCVSSNVYAGDLNLNNLTFKAELKENGDMDVTEIWDIDIWDTNTLYKTFKLNEQGYDGFSNATLYEIKSNGEKIPFSQINEEMYHVTKGSYYALVNSNSDYEIAWGVSINGNKVKKYEMNYTVKNIIHNYKDCSELYWQFIGRDFEINANSVKGTIILPENEYEKENIRVWAHGPLNGNIYAITNNKVEFEVQNFIAGNMLEVRIATPTAMFPLSTRVYEDEEFGNIIAEETAWADKANRERKKAENIRKILDYGCIIFVIGAVVFFIIKLKKYFNLLIQNPKKKPYQKLDYYRDIPGGDDTVPTDATFLLGMMYNTPNIISSILLDLALRKAIKFEIVKDKKEINIELLLGDDKNIDLREEEKNVYEYLQKIAKKENTFSMKEFEKYIEKHPSSFNSLTNRIVKHTKNSQIEREIYDEQEEEKSQNYKAIGGLYIFFSVVTLFISLGIVSTLCNKWRFVTLTSLLYIILSIMSFIVSSRFSGFTQKGINEREKWKGLKKYMKDFSYINEKEVPALVLWEKYLVYATAIGIAEKVLKELKVKYPSLFEADNLNGTAYMYLMYDNGLNRSLVNSISSSVNRAYSSANYSSSNYSSGSGRWRWLFRRWPEVALAVEAAEVVKQNRYKKGPILGPFLYIILRFRGYIKR